MLEYIILGFLMYKEMTGYDLKQCMINSTSNFFDASFGSIYPALKKMEDKGLVSSNEAVDGGKYKKYYAITKDGETDFRNWLEQEIDFSKTKPDHLVKVFFFGFLPKEKAVNSLNKFIEEVEQVHKRLTEYENQVKLHADTYQLSTLVFGMDYYRLIINWSKDLLQQLEKQS